MSGETVDVFISHSSKDEIIAKGIADLIANTFHMPNKHIRCSSVKGYKFSGGSDLHPEIRREAVHSKVFIGLITENSLNSRYVQFELGARWGSDKRLIPLLGPGYDRSILKDGPLSSLIPLECKAESITDLLDTIEKEIPFSLSTQGISGVNGKVADFIILCNEADDDSNTSESVSTPIKSEEKSQISDENVIDLNKMNLSDEALRLLMTFADRSGIGYVDDGDKLTITNEDSKSSSAAYRQGRYIQIKSRDELLRNKLIEKFDSKLSHMPSDCYRITNAGYEVHHQNSKKEVW